jgi:ribosomal protein S18 acetylase RimI-like enzyme
MLPEQWQTERLQVRNALPGDVDRLQAVFNANNHVEVWDPTFRYAPRDEIAELVDASVAGLSKRGKPFQLQTFGPDPQTLAGYYHMTFGVPRPEVIWFSMFVIHPDFQQHRYGPEVMADVHRHFAALPQMTTAWAEVWLKNWPALRFWTACGYNRIVEFDGDRVYSAEGHASVILAYVFREQARK